MAAKITEGVERGRCTGPQDVKFGVAQSGNMQIGLLFEITSGERKGMRATYYGNVEGSPEAVKITAEALFACGWDGKSWTELNGITKNCVRLVFKQEGDRVKLAYVNPDTAVVFNSELSKEDAAARLAKLAGKANGVAPHMPSMPPPHEEEYSEYEGPV